MATPEELQKAERDRSTTYEVDRARLAAERQREAGPAERLAEEHQKPRVREAAAFRGESGATPEPEPERKNEATRMAYRPTGLQQGPSPGGPGYFNSRVAAPRRETLLDRLEREESEQGRTLGDDVQVERERRMEMERRIEDERRR